jgi:beta-lactam-binding protein with PASTA domain
MSRQTSILLAVIIVLAVALLIAVIALRSSKNEAAETPVPTIDGTAIASATAAAQATGTAVTSLYLTLVFEQTATASAP